MSKVASLAFSVMLAVVTTVGCQALGRDIEPAATTVASGSALTDIHPAYLYGRTTTDSGDSYEGRLRWGRHPGAAREFIRDAPSRSSGSRFPIGQRTMSGGLSWRASATSLASKRMASQCA